MSATFGFTLDQMSDMTYKQINGYLRAAKTQSFRQHAPMASLTRTVSLALGGKESDLTKFLPEYAIPSAKDDGFKWPKQARADVRAAHKNKWLAREALAWLDNNELTKVLNEK